MTDFLELVLTVFAIWAIASLAHFLSKRITLLRRILSLKKTCKAKITLHKSIFKPMWRTSESPDVTVKILDTTYLIRIYSGGSGAMSVHFANEKFSTVYLRWRASARAPHGTGAASLAMSGGINLYAKVHALPPLAEGCGEGGRVVRVMILNPAPSVLSYVAPNKASIKIAFTGDELYGVRVFTDTSFIRYAERMMREEIREKSGRANEYEFFRGK